MQSRGPAPNGRYEARSTGRGASGRNRDGSNVSGWDHTLPSRWSRYGDVMIVARKNGMRVVYDGPETDAYLALPRATPGSILSEWVWDQNARFAHDFRRSTRVVLDALDVMAARPAR